MVAVCCIGIATDEAGWVTVGFWGMVSAVLAQANPLYWNISECPLSTFLGLCSFSMSYLVSV